MKKFTFSFDVHEEFSDGKGRPRVSLRDELEFPDHVEEETLGFDIEAFGELIFKLYLLTFCKGKHYGDSWKKRGEIRGCMSNMDRKYDRISKSADDITDHGHNDPVPRLDGTGDLVVYGLLYLSSFLKQKYPKEFEEWLEKDVDGFIERYRAKIVESGGVLPSTEVPRATSIRLKP